MQVVRLQLLIKLDRDGCASGLDYLSDCFWHLLCEPNGFFSLQNPAIARDKLHRKCAGEHCSNDRNRSYLLYGLGLDIMCGQGHQSHDSESIHHLVCCCSLLRYRDHPPVLSFSRPLQSRLRLDVCENKLNPVFNPF